MNFNFPGRGTIDLSVSVALMQLLKCVKLLIQYKTPGSLGALVSVCVLLLQLGSVENKGTFYRRLPLVAKNGIDATFLWASY